MSDDEWVTHWRKEILSPPTDNVEILVTASSDLRQLSIEFSESPANLNILELERNGISLLCNAIMAGAFKGSEWLLWRTRLADRPHIINAAKFLKKYGPFQNRSFGYAGWKAGQAAVETIADAIDLLAKEMVDALPNAPAPTKAKRRQGRPKGTTQTDVTNDKKIYTDWKAADTTIADFSRRRGIPFAEVDAAIKRHKRRLYELKKNQ